MNNPKHLALTLLLVTAGHAAFAVDDKSDEMWQKLYRKLATVVYGGVQSPDGFGKNDSVISLCVPGIPLGDMEKDDKEAEIHIARMLDETPEYDPVFRPGKRPFSQIYDDILKYHQADEPIPMSKEDEAAVAKAMETLDPDGEIMRKYLHYEEAYVNACVAREEARWDRKPTTKLDTAVNKAQNDWIGPGQKDKVWSAYHTVRTKGSKDPGVWWTQLQNNFNDSIMTTRDGAAVHAVTTYPPIHLWSGEKGWVSFTYTASKKTESKEIKEKDRSMSANLSFGLKKVKGGATSEMQSMKSLSTDASLTISMDLKRVLISRPWFDWRVFESTAWTWDRDLISDGKGGGTMPLYVNSILIVRNVKFKSEKIENMKEAIKKELTYNTKGSYGPFSVETKGRNKSEDESALDMKEEGAIKIKEPQILGYVCTIVPACPAKKAAAISPDKKPKPRK